MAQPTPTQRMEHVIRTYIQACNAADAAAIAACFCPEAAHYLPTPRRKWAGAVTIGNNFATKVREQGVSWPGAHRTIDGVRGAPAPEWSRRDRRQAQLIRGVDRPGLVSQT